jgi:hypothetical protein
MMIYPERDIAPKHSGALKLFFHQKIMPSTGRAREFTRRQ